MKWCYYCQIKSSFHSKWNVGLGPCWRNPLVSSILSSILRQLPKQTSEDSVTATGSWQHLILLGHCPLRCGICSKFLYQFMVLFLLLQQFVGPEIKRWKWEWVPHCTIYNWDPLPNFLLSHIWALWVTKKGIPSSGNTISLTESWDCHPATLDSSYHWINKQRKLLH